MVVLTRVLLMVNCSLFIMDTNEAVDARTTADRAIDRNLMFDLETLMRTCNPFVEAYRMMHEVEQEALAASGSRFNPFEYDQRYVHSHVISTVFRKWWIWLESRNEAATGSRTRVTNMQWIQYMVADRRDFFNPCLYGGRLFQQFMVDNWVKVEQQRAAPFVAEAESENAQG
ncbi:hypothetical protein L596_005578 [Steinernema carpocapsae]|uniref:Uncharacterized protein n=1 Tax=Steinernema carpocapsae TaxID=34508 RepID=A0A4U8UZG5_STECR|nr:hypothetical protein L596_005578 [Steinernema carpocapsae]